jgi:hypothetical protein
MLVVELVEVKLVLFPHCLAERQCDRTLNQPNKVWHVFTSVPTSLGEASVIG